MSTQLLIEKLQNSALYDHPVKQFTILETHISWVILTGKYAYKIKKPVDFEVLDFSQLEKRKHFCEQEVKLNKQLAAELYVDVVKITGSESDPKINGEGPAIEYAVRMVEFPQEEIFTRLLARQELTPTLIEQVAKTIADFHATTEIAPADSIYGSPEHVHAPVKQNFTQMIPWLENPLDQAEINYLSEWAEKQFQKNHDLFAKRKRNGFIRECHGDIHLGNIIYQNKKPILFDRIEFNWDLIWTDVLADIGFLAMDLQDHHQFGLANRLINTYLSYTGDYEGLALLRYYLSYRAMVRAKVGLFRLTQPDLDEAGQKAMRQKYRNFIGLAEKYTHTIQPALIITYGLAGSGKSTVARELVEKLGAIQINSDVERKRLFNLPLSAQTQSELNQGVYSPEATEKTYAQLAALAEMIIKAGYTAVVDATFIRQSHRQQFAKLAQQLKVPFVILHCHTSQEELSSRIKQRKTMENQPSEAGEIVQAWQNNNIEALTTQEQPSVIDINTNELNQDDLIKRISQLLS